MPGLVPAVPEAAARAIAEGAGNRRDWLRQNGELVIGSGCLSAGAIALAVHTDYGPPSQDKETNQDYALAWSGGAGEGAGVPLLALALADGVTSAYRAEWAAELACAVSLQTLVAGLLAPPPAAGRRIAARDRATAAVATAQRALAEVGDILAADPEPSCPPGQYLSTWKYILRKGAFLQTTLTLAWVDGRTLHVAMIGDGGLALRGAGRRLRGEASDDELLGEADLGSDEVNALGPREPEPESLDVWKERPWHGIGLCALYTDGIGRGMQRGGLRLLDLITQLRRGKPDNAAELLIRNVVDMGRPGFDDNLTLAVLARD